MSQSNKLSKLKKLFRYVTDKNYRFLVNAGHHKYDQMPDDEFLKRKYKAIFGKALDLKHPVTFSEKLQWQKLYDRNPLYTQLVDKYKVREYVAKKIGAAYSIPLLGVWDDPDDIDFDALPEQFVLKCNHNSGLGMYICKSKSQITDFETIRQNLRIGLKEDKYLQNREWPYKNVERKIIAEEYKEDRETHELRDYKFFTFNGKVRALFIASDRQTTGEETKFDFFDENGQHLPFTNGHPNAEIPPALPRNFEKMKQLAEVLAEGIPQVRVDFYEVNGQVFFGEMTFFHWSGLKPFDPEEWDRKFGDWLDLLD